MFLNKIKLLNFLKSTLPSYSFIKDSKTLLSYSAFFQNSNAQTVVFLSGFYKYSSLLRLQEKSRSWGETIWITPNSFFYRKYFTFLQPLYFIKKEKTSFELYDRRFLKTEKGLYQLPPKKIEVEYFFKNPLLLSQEETFLFPKRTNSFYCKGDSTDHLNNQKHLKSLEIRCKKPNQSSVKIIDKTYLWLKKNLDK